MEFLQFSFMQKALLAGIIVGSLSAFLGVFVVLQNLAFLGTGIAHAAFAGIAIGYLLGVNPIAFTYFFCVIAGLGIAILAQSQKIREDTAVGIMFSSSMALGIFVVSFFKVSNTDLFGYLFGNILAVTRQDLIFSTIVAIFSIFTVLFYLKEITASILDFEMATVIGIPAVGYKYFLVALISLCIAISIRIAGIILVSALLVIPGATALQVSKTLKRALTLSTIIGAGTSLAGLSISYYLNSPPGSTIVLFAGCLFLLIRLMRFNQ
ncbi:MAG: zinc transport system permease protein [Candidatus Atribacteria bacterium]|nr:zinc transport system permease protein [Candidatus Atribacteria bacterium]MDI3530536.1 zinc transport system permease protein [Candidatus Atribacteria bacterium]